MLHCGIYYLISQILFGSVHKKAVSTITKLPSCPWYPRQGFFFELKRREPSPQLVNVKQSSLSIRL